MQLNSSTNKKIKDKKISHIKKKTAISFLNLLDITLGCLLLSHVFYFVIFPHKYIINCFEGNAFLLSLYHPFGKEISVNYIMIVFLLISFVIGALVFKKRFIQKAWLPTLIYGFFWFIFLFLPIKQDQIYKISQNFISYGKGNIITLLTTVLIANILLWDNDKIIADYKVIIKILTKIIGFSAYFWFWILDGLLMFLILFLCFIIPSINNILSSAQYIWSLVMIIIPLILYFQYSEVFEENYKENFTFNSLTIKNKVILKKLLKMVVYLYAFIYFGMYIWDFWDSF